MKSRLQRGLGRLRMHLDSEHQGRREEWLSALVPMISYGGPIMATKSNVVAAAAAAVLIAGAGVAYFEPWSPRPTADSPEFQPIRSETGSVVATQEEPGARRLETPVREEVEPVADAVSRDEVRRLLSSSRRLDQVRAIEFLVEQDTPEAAQLLLDTYLVASDRVLLALLQEALLSPTLELAPRLVEAFRAESDPEQLSRLAEVLAGIAKSRPDLAEGLAGMFVEALADPGLDLDPGSAIEKALVSLGTPALAPLSTFLANPRSDPRAAGTAAAILARLDADPKSVGEAFQSGFEALDGVLDDPFATAEDQDAARKKSGSLAWAASKRPADEHDALSRGLVESFLRATDEPQAGTLAWGLGNLEGLTDEGRYEAVRKILDSVRDPPVPALRQTYVQAIRGIVVAGYGNRPLDSQFERIRDAVNDSWDHNRSDAEIAARIDWLLTALAAFEQECARELQSQQ